MESGKTIATLRHTGRNFDWATPGIYNYFVSGLSAAPYGAVLTPTGAAPLSSHNHPVRFAHVFGDGPARMQVASADAGGRLAMSGIAYPMSRALFDVEGHDGTITALAVSPTHKHAATGGADGTVQVWVRTPLAADLQAAIMANTDPVAMICNENGHYLLPTPA